MNQVTSNLTSNDPRSFLDKQSYILRSMFYLLHPNETYIKELKNVPDFTAKAGNMFIALILVEQAIFLLKHGRFNGRISDSLTSLGAGIYHTFPVLFFRELNILLYEWIYKNYLLYELPYDNIWTYIVTFLFVDMMYYWFHRAAHEVNLFWAAHQTHHSSEDYNLSTAIRQSMFQKYTSWFFYFPLAFFVSPSIYLVHTHMNLLYQFWIHTELIGKLGPLEYILNTASHHRVHHGRNPYCIDKNYAGVLIIWDRMFGTFAEEKETEELAYGLVHPVETFDPTYLQVFNYQYVLSKFWNAKSLNEKFSVLFKGPGWIPGTGRLGNHEDLPSIQYPIIKKGTEIPSVLNYYVLAHFAFVITIFFEFLNDFKSYPNITLSVFIAVILYSLTCFGMFFDNNKNAVYYDLFRCLIFTAIGSLYKSNIKALLFNSEHFYQSFVYINAISLIIMLLLALRKLTYANESSMNKRIDINNNNIATKSSKRIKPE